MQPKIFEEIRRTLYACDGIVIGSPTCCLQPNAIMKNVFDRGDLVHKRSKPCK
jgi:multimeric flavodoxin WrbA